MELNALDRQFFVPKRHYESVGRFRRDLKLAGHGFAFDDKRMITPRIKILRNAVKERASVVTDRNQLSVHRFRAADDVPAEVLSDRLMSETNAEDRHLARKMLDRRDRNARVLGRSGSGRYYEMRWLEIAFDRLDGHLVISNDAHLGAKLAEILDEVVCERIVIVDNNEHRSF